MTSEAIEGRPVTNLSDALSGQLAGVQTQTGSGIPGEEMQITVRGVSSINGSSNPLIVVDGVITENMSNVNPSRRSIYPSIERCGSHFLSILVHAVLPV